MDVSALPALNATLNATSGVLLTAGYLLVRRGRIPAHRACMVSAFGVSALFLISYGVYHASAGSRPFTGQGPARLFYFTVLITHSILAAAVPVLAVMTLARALRGRFGRHASIARWTLPIWLYVSVTGVIVYWMLYQ